MLQELVDTIKTKVHVLKITNERRIHDRRQEGSRNISEAGRYLTKCFDPHSDGAYSREGLTASSTTMVIDRTVTLVRSTTGGAQPVAANFKSAS